MIEAPPMPGIGGQVGEPPEKSDVSGVIETPEEFRGAEVTKGQILTGIEGKAKVVTPESSAANIQQAWDSLQQQLPPEMFKRVQDAVALPDTDPKKDEMLRSLRAMLGDENAGDFNAAASGGALSQGIKQGGIQE